MATSAATVAAAMAAKARREISEQFERENSFEPDSAVAYDSPDRIHRTQFDTLVGRGIVKITQDGLYWWDKDAERADKERRRAAALLMLKLILIAVAIGVAVAAIMSARH